MTTIGEESPLTRFASRVRFPAHISHPLAMSDFTPRDDRSWEERTLRQAVGTGDS